MNNTTLRDLATSEVATLAGLAPSTVRDWLASGCASTISRRAHGRRWHSPRDAAVVRLATELTRIGWAPHLAVVAVAEMLPAVEAGRRYLAMPPRPDGRVGMALDDPPADLRGAGWLVLPAGEMLAEVYRRAAKLRGAA
ncbi:hypothetical protein J2X65_004603 [Ancylobacter sp. 3268]|uniref:hypothetical protein n=1 Tax=Ancylobacter sp. 3268 TaxID=2817752 RepID=UPI002864CC3F|nr:hypothetical protein [Ancylobacter sp. 3268]MDR6955224.1 hypothetical protein [Ancylobacter sp. 3268]